MNYISEGYAYSSTFSTNTNNNVKTRDNEYKFYSLMLPLRIVIPVMGKYCKHLPSISANFSYALKQTHLQTEQSENGPLIKNVYDIKKDYSRFIPSLSIAYGVEFDLDQVYSLRFEPTYQFSFVNTKSSGNKTMINNIGLRVYFLFLR